MSKDEMKRKHNIESPNLADAVAMAMTIPKSSKKAKANKRKLSFKGWR
jgi:hypothetical protein